MQSYNTQQYLPALSDNEDFGEQVLQQNIINFQNNIMVSKTVDDDQDMKRYSTNALPTTFDSLEKNQMENLISQNYLTASSGNILKKHESSKKRQKNKIQRTSNCRASLDSHKNFGLRSNATPFNRHKHHMLEDDHFIGLPNKNSLHTGSLQVHRGNSVERKASKQKNKFGLVRGSSLVNQQPKAKTFTVKQEKAQKLNQQKSVSKIDSKSKLMAITDAADIKELYVLANELKLQQHETQMQMAEMNLDIKKVEQVTVDQKVEIDSMREDLSNRVKNAFKLAKTMNHHIKSDIQPQIETLSQQVNVMEPQKDTSVDWSQAIQMQLQPMQKELAEKNEIISQLMKLQEQQQGELYHLKSEFRSQGEKKGG